LTLKASPAPAAALPESAPTRFRDPQIEMSHGAGGKASRKLVEGLFAPLLFGAAPGPLGDAAHVDIDGIKVAITTDSFVVKPLSFPGGSIGELAVNGTVSAMFSKPDCPRQFSKPKFEPWQKPRGRRVFALQPETQKSSSTAKRTRCI
jgi:hypothetical protein